MTAKTSTDPPSHISCSPRTSGTLKNIGPRSISFVPWAGPTNAPADANNLAYLRRGGGQYFVVAMPWRKGTEADGAAAHPGRFQEVRENLQVNEARLGDRCYVVCFNC